MFYMKKTTDILHMHFLTTQKHALPNTLNENHCNKCIYPLAQKKFIAFQYYVSLE